MTSSRKETHGSKAFVGALGWVALLMVSYWVLADWQGVPKLISSFVGALAGLT